MLTGMRVDVINYPLIFTTTLDMLSGLAWFPNCSCHNYRKK